MKIQNVFLTCFSFFLGCSEQSFANIAYVTDIDGQRVYVVDTATNAVTALVSNIPSPLSLAGVTFTPDGSTAYVLNHFPTPEVYVINAATNAFTQEVTDPTMTAFMYPAQVAVTPDGSLAYVTDLGGYVFVVETATNAVIAEVTNTTGTPFVNPFGIAITPDGNFVYVADTGAPAVFVINTSTNIAELVTNMTMDAFAFPQNVAITPDGSTAYVTDTVPGDVFVIDTMTMPPTVTGVVGSMPAGAVPYAVAVAPDGHAVYFTDIANKTFCTIVSNAVTETLLVTTGSPSLLSDIALTPDGQFAYVPDNEAHTVSVINTVTNTIVTTVSTTGFPSFISPFAIAINPINTISQKYYRPFHRPNNRRLP